MPSSKTSQNLDLFQAANNESETLTQQESRSTPATPKKRKAKTTAIQSPHVHSANSFAERYLTVLEVAQRYGLSKSSVWRLAGEDKGFPQPLKLAEGTTRWQLSKLLEYEHLRSEVSARKGK